MQVYVLLTLVAFPQAAPKRESSSVFRGTITRVFDDGQLEFTGENTIDHTPKNETVRVYLGNAFDVVGERKPGAELTVVMHRSNGERVEFPVKCRLDTADEVSVYEAGGVLQRFAQDFLEAGAAA